MVPNLSGTSHGAHVDWEGHLDTLSSLTLAYMGAKKVVCVNWHQYECEDPGFSSCQWF